MSISIKISEENYKTLCSLSGKLREELHKPVSINDAISYLSKKRKLSSLAGHWKMDEQEAKELSNSLKKGWSKWSIKSA